MLFCSNLPTGALVSADMQWPPSLLFPTTWCVCVTCCHSKLAMMFKVLSPPRNVSVCNMLSSQTCNDVYSAVPDMKCVSV